MGRPLRSIPKNDHGVLVEVTTRTHGARALLVPTRDPRPFNETLLGVTGRALEVARGTAAGSGGPLLELCGCVWLSTHAHWLCVVREPQTLARFMQHLKCNTTKEIDGQYRQWGGALWQRRYDAIPVSDEPHVQWSRLKYLLSHGVKEGLVESPLDWPGVHCAKALVHGEPLEGVWFNRSKEWAATNRGLEVGRYDFATRYLIHFAQLPAFQHLTPEEYQNRIAELIVEIQEEGESQRDGNSVAGVDRILSQNPYVAPTRKPKKSARPLFHVNDPQLRKDLLDERWAITIQHSEASEALRSGNLKAADWFPEGTFPPALPFNGAPPPPRVPRPPTRRIKTLESGEVERGDVPVVEVPATPRPKVPEASPCSIEPRARGQPP